SPVTRRCGFYHGYRGKMQGFWTGLPVRWSLSFDPSNKNLRSLEQELAIPRTRNLSFVHERSFVFRLECDCTASAGSARRGCFGGGRGLANLPRFWPRE